MDQLEAIFNGETSTQQLVDVGKNVQKALTNGWYTWQAIAVGRDSAAYQRTVQAILDTRGQGGSPRAALKATRRSQGLTGAHRYYKSMRRLQADRAALGNAQGRYPRSQGTHHRYGEMAPEVREICERYGLPYNSGGLGQQFGSVVRKITRLALP